MVIISVRKRNERGNCAGPAEGGMILAGGFRDKGGEQRARAVHRVTQRSNTEQGAAAAVAL